MLEEPGAVSNRSNSAEGVREATNNTRKSAGEVCNTRRNSSRKARKTSTKGITVLQGPMRRLTTGQTILKWPG